MTRASQMSETTQVSASAASDKVGNVDFNCLSVGDREGLQRQMMSLRNCATEYMIAIPDKMMHSDVASILSQSLCFVLLKRSHFNSIEVDEEDVVQSFLSRLDHVTPRIQYHG